ncbi:MAG: DNA gyrase subunit A [Planctomycetes bacterium]|nr:DNA gyrase subunit A [Planctomycetota bacterium]
MTEPRDRVEGLLIEEEMKGSYLDYAMSVIVSRALPDVRDGLAKIAGDTTGNYHPHGDTVIYPTLVRLAQDFVMRYRLIQGQGNFGSVDGDPPAAMRYTEARMTEAAVTLLEDLDKDTVDFAPNYDNSRQEPTIFPGAFPNLLCNGSSGIAVGMATSIAPHNAGEICDGLLRLLDEPQCTVEQLFEIIKGPDFPTGGLICGRRGILEAYRTGRGLLTVRGRVSFEHDEKRNRTAIVITEIPYQLNKTALIEQIAGAVKDDRIPAVADLRDESDKDGMRIVVELKKGEDEKVTLNQLYKFSALEDTFSIINIALVGGRPKTLGLKEMLEAYVSHRRDVIRRRTRFLLDKAERRLHIVEGLRIAVDHIAEVIQIIRGAADADAARRALMSRFALSEAQTNAILQMRLQQLTGLEREKLEEEHRELVEEIARLRAILADPALVDELIRADVREVKRRFGDARRTDITAAVDSLEDEDLIPDDTMAVTVSHRGYIKRLPLDTYRRQGRGGVGVTGGGSKDEDFLEHLYVAQNHDYILCLTDRGQLHWLKVHKIPLLTRQSSGRSIMNVLSLRQGEKITSMIPVRDFSRGYLFMATRRGVVKMTALAAFKRPKKTGIIAISLDEDDALVGVAVVGQDDEVMLGTAKGQAIRFPLTAVRPMGRNARGVTGIKPKDDDHVVSLVVVDATAAVLTVGANGLGKRTPFEEYRVTNRGGVGIISLKVSGKTGDVVALIAVREGDDLMLMTEGSMVVRIAADSVSQVGRSTQGVKLISLREGDRLVAVVPVVKEDTEGESPRAVQGEPLNGENGAWEDVNQENGEPANGSDDAEDGEPPSEDEREP